MQSLKKGLDASRTTKAMAKSMTRAQTKAIKPKAMKKAGTRL